MFGGVTNGYPAFTEEPQSQYDMSALPQFQLFDKFPAGCAIEKVNFVGNENTTASGRPIKRVREVGPGFTQQKVQRSLNNLCQDDAGLARTAMNQNHVSTGLKLSYGEDERNSSITSVNENLSGLRPVTCSLANSIQLEMDCQHKLLDHYVKVQEENMMKGIRELNQKHTALLLNTLETEVRKKLNEKDVEILIMNRRNMELGLKIKQASMEAQAWHYRAKYNESVVNALKNNLQQVIPPKNVQQKEGYGDSEVDDAASYTNANDALGNPNQSFSTKQLSCKACNGKDVSVLLLPCRHLCLCKDCEAFVENCPVCQTTRTESVHVFMS
ncbi:putative transcription factor C2H2 family [Helianthus annuus]|uniref:Putative zinc finger, RING/FYVE/PHD-type, E3 ubiquitin-protein ligase BOI n=1 Tax=Helianthus annuus TaxID=4232 RepID=A0A251RWP3_HELAN|nr:BOI-related E3 ubiquitin-protein ligase 1 [Helianthus annuus]KAF5758580.1 putative transcription factor C2H2 family [Helianthus annuus]KAJ0436899.1 putative transcription factor C2H2 family [Helianthus annuus]